MQRVLRVLLVVVAVVVAGVAGYLIAHHPSVPDAGQTPGAASQPVVESQPATTTPPSSPDSPAPVVAFLGDDWTAGTGASSPARRFTTRLSDQLRLTERNFGAAGTGYAKASATDGPYASRITALVQAHPQIVVVSGGRNDSSDYAPTLDAQVAQLFTALHAQLPHATLVGIAPMWGDSDMPAQISALGPVVQAAVTAVGGVYLDLPDPIHGHPSYMADAADPDDAGYAAIAAALAPRLAALIPR